MRSKRTFSTSTISPRSGTVKPRTQLAAAALAMLALAIGCPNAAPPVARSTTAARADRAARPTYAFQNGHWFDGQSFRDRVFYSVDGVLTEHAPAAVDKTVDLAGGYVVPPFADAHNHYIAGPNRIDAILHEYLKDGIFYAKNPASIRRDTQKIAHLVNKPDSVDVVFANAGITATGGHPVRLYEQTLRKVKTPGPDGTFENLGYIILDDDADLAKKWPMILADGPDFLKVHLLYSEDFDKLRVDPAAYGNRGMDPSFLPRVVAKAHEAHLRVSCHIETAADFRNALAADVDEINHLPGYFAENPRLERFVITRDDAALAARKHTVVVTTTYVSTAEIKDPKELAINREVQVKNLRTLHDAHVEIALGPDVYGVTALAEAMNVHELGVFDNLTLLKMWSESSARTIFPARKIGRLAEGYEASFLVLGGDPIARFEHVKDIRLRFKQGAFITLAAREQTAQ